MVTTQEQEEGLDAALSSLEPVAWVGYPGSGKTTMMGVFHKELGDASSAWDTLCFSKMNQMAMRKMVPNNGVRTTHSLAWSLCAYHWRKNRTNWNLDDERHLRFATWAAEDFYNKPRAAMEVEHVEAIDGMVKCIELVQSHLIDWKDFGKVVRLSMHFNKEPSDTVFIYEKIDQVMRWVSKGLSKSEADAADGQRYRICDGFEFSDLTWAVATRPYINCFSDRTQGMIVDEVQDTLPVEHAVWKRRLGDSRRLILVGDPAQSIYFFRNVFTDTYGKLVKHHGARLYPMRTSFRLPRAVLSLARQWVPDLEISKDAIDGSLDTIDMSDLPGRVGPGSAIITMTNAQAIRWALYLFRNKIPAVVPGTDIGKDMVKRVRDLTTSKLRFEDFPDRLADWTQAQVAVLRAVHKNNPEAYVQANNEAMQSLLYLYHGAAEVGVTSMGEFISYIKALFSTEEDAHGNAVRCMTAHKAKGQEFPHVVVEYNDITGVRGNSMDEIAQYKACQYVMCTRTLGRMDVVKEGIVRNEDRW